ncbi:unnamed protein product [Rhizopus stolonifer]
MEKKESSFQLWSPPALDLSLDSFSTDILSQFGKQEPRNSIIEINPNSQVTDSSESLDLSPVEPNRSSVLYESRVSCSMDRGATPSLMEESSIKRSSSFRKSRISQRESVEITADSILSVTNDPPSPSSFSPKPLEYAPVMELPSETIEPDQQSVVSSVSSKQEYLTVQVDTESLAASQLTEKDPVEKEVPESPTTPERGVCTSTQPKRRSIFFFRFC